MFEHGAGTAAAHSEINSHQSPLPALNDDPYDADVEELPGPSRATEVIARRVKHSRLGRRSREVVQKLSEDALMRRYLDTYKCLTSHLKAPLEGQRFARLSHIFQDGRTFGFASALIKAGNRKFGIVCVIWQTRVNPRRAVCVSFYKNTATRILTAICTCCPLRRQSQQDESSCCHSRVCFDSEELVSSVEEILNDRTEMIGNRFVQFPHFGDCIDVDDPESPQTVKLSLKRTRQAHAYARKWKFEIVFDVSQSIFLPVLKEQHRATRCLLCRGNPERRMRCVHEEVCRRGRHRSEVQAHLREGDESDDSEWETDEDRNQGQIASIRIDADETEEYSPVHFPRPLLPCNGQVRDMRTLVDQVETGENLTFNEKNVIDCHVCGTRNTQKPIERYKREICLFTLTQGTVRVSVYDWYCRTCGKMRRYSGTMDGIYPAGKTFGYSTELMYFWLSQVCLQGLSFRAAYKTSILINNSPGLKHRNARIPIVGLTRLESEKKRSRRRASTAFYNFLRTITTNSSTIANELFSCPTCEVPLSAQDCTELGINEADKGELKRLRAIVIDGTAAGILNRLPEMERNMFEIRSINEDAGPRRVPLIQRLVTKPRHRKILDKLLSMTKEAMRALLKRRRATPSNPISSTIRFWLTTECTDAEGIEKTKTTFTQIESRLLQMLCTQNSCICQEGLISGVPMQNHSEDCLDIRTSFLNANEPNEIIELLSNVFKISGGHESASILLELDDMYAADAETDPSVSSDASESSSETVNDSDDNDGHEAGTQDLPADMGPILPIEDDLMGTPSTTEGGLFASLSLNGLFRNPQFTESLVSLLHLLLCEHVAMPYLGRIPGRGESIQSPSMLSFTSETLRLHENVASSVQTLLSCMHIGMNGAISLQDDCSCNLALRKSLMEMQDANPVLETFCVELLKERRPLSSRLRLIMRSLVQLLRRHMEAAQSFFTTFETKCGDDIKDYWSKYSLRDPRSAQEIMNGDIESGIWFPGRQQCRPGIMFSTNDIRQCRKKYTRSQRHSPGIMTVQCACQSPKLLGFIIMTRAESVSLALSSLLTHFPILPRMVYYDNSCNMFSSAVLRVPWIFRQTRMAVDRFHYKAHKCNALFNPDSYSNLDAHRTETAESINARIEKSLPYMRYLGTDNLLPFLRTRLSLINLCAVHQQKYNRADLEDEDLNLFFQEVCRCNCILCQAYDTELEIRGDGVEQETQPEPEQHEQDRNQTQSFIPSQPVATENSIRTVVFEGNQALGVKLN